MVTIWYFKRNLVTIFTSDFVSYNVIEQLNNKSYLTKNFQKVQTLTKQIFSNLIKHPNQLINTIDNANTYLCKNGKSNIELINYKNIIGLYYPTNIQLNLIMENILYLKQNLLQFYQ